MYTARFAAFLFDLVSAAEDESRAAARFRKKQARLNELLDLLIEVKPQFFVEFALDSVAAKQGPQANQDVAEHLPLPESLSMENCLGRP